MLPVVFAIITGRALKAAALYRAERGETIGVLEQLLGSSSLAAWLTIQVQLRKLNALSVLLLVLWSLSPLGGQAALRIVYEARRTYYSDPVQLQYLDMQTPSLLASTRTDVNTSAALSFADSVFQTALFSPRNRMPTDIFDNVRIPLVEASPAYEDGIEDWLPVSDWVNNWPTDRLSIASRNRHGIYTNLLGHPVDWIGANAPNQLPLDWSYTLHTSYFLFDCSGLYATNSSLFDEKL